MKRSQINSLIRSAEMFFAESGFHLPPFGHWTPEQWAQNDADANEIRERKLGWDVTDLGGGDFDTMGLILFTLRNGDSASTSSSLTKPYAEKIMIVSEGQVTPWHFHWQKTEDIINRGGGDLVVELAWATDDEADLSERDVTVACDGIERVVPSRGSVTLSPGESITLPPLLYHTFYGARGKGTVLVGEVSSVNDDSLDNRFLEPLGRYPAIDEDEIPFRLLCTEYP